MRLRREIAVVLRPLKRCEEAQAPPLGKRTPETKGDKELTQTPIFYTQRKKLLHNRNLSDII